MAAMAGTMGAGTTTRHLGADHSSNGRVSRHAKAQVQIRWRIAAEARRNVIDTAYAKNSTTVAFTASISNMVLPTFLASLVDHGRHALQLVFGDIDGGAVDESGHHLLHASIKERVDHVAQS